MAEKVEAGCKANPETTFFCMSWDNPTVFIFPQTAFLPRYPPAHQSMQLVYLEVKFSLIKSNPMCATVEVAVNPAKLLFPAHLNDFKNYPSSVFTM